ncbi:MAG: VWA domain-containing protein [Acidobacteria bacterium]|nr:VWA domain-containing protein [Acidobacteriota bacterium]
MGIDGQLSKLTLISLVVVLVGSTLVETVAQNRPKPVQTKSTRPQKIDQPKKTLTQQVVASEDQPIEVSDEIVKIDTGYVQLDVTVVDQTNTPVYNLSRENFTVYEDRVQQVIESVSREEVPISFGLVVDTSGSMRSKIQEVSGAALGLLRQMRADDEGFVAQFQYQTELIQTFTRDKLKLEKSLNVFQPDGGTALLDAIIATSEYTAKKGKQRRKALIIISDGLERNSAIKEKEVMEAIKENEVQVYLIGFIPDEESSSSLSLEANKKARELLGRLADESGGRAFFPRDVNEMDAIATQIAKDLRSQYTLNYYPTNENRDGTYRSIRVVVNSKDKRKLIARTRLGYFSRTDREPERSEVQREPR